MLAVLESAWQCLFEEVIYIPLIANQIKHHFMFMDHFDTLINACSSTLPIDILGSVFPY